MNYPLTPAGRLALQTAISLLEPLLEQLQRAWQTHLRLLAENPRYAAAVAAAAATLTGQDTPLDVIAALAAALLAIHTAARALLAHS